MWWYRYLTVRNCTETERKITRTEVFVLGDPAPDGPVDHRIAGLAFLQSVAGATLCARVACHELVQPTGPAFTCHPPQSHYRWASALA
jgi:hypothetical protein